MGRLRLSTKTGLFIALLGLGGGCTNYYAGVSSGIKKLNQTTTTNSKSNNPLSLTGPTSINYGDSAVTYTVLGGKNPISFRLNPSLGSLALTTSLSAQYTPPPTGTVPAIVSVIATDASGQSVSVTVSLVPTNITDPGGVIKNLVITGPATTTYGASPSTFATSGGTGAITFSLGSGDIGQIAVSPVANTSAVYTPPAQGTSPRTVTIKAQDSTLKTATKTITVSGGSGPTTNPCMTTNDPVSIKQGGIEIGSALAFDASTVSRTLTLWGTSAIGPGGITIAAPATSPQSVPIDGADHVYGSGNGVITARAIANAATCETSLVLNTASTVSNPTTQFTLSAKDARTDSSKQRTVTLTHTGSSAPSGCTDGKQVKMKIAPADRAGTLITGTGRILSSGSPYRVNGQTSQGIGLTIFLSQDTPSASPDFRATVTAVGDSDMTYIRSMPSGSGSARYFYFDTTPGKENEVKKIQQYQAIIVDNSIDVAQRYLCGAVLNIDLYPAAMDNVFTESNGYPKIGKLNSDNTWSSGLVDWLNTNSSFGDSLGGMFQSVFKDPTGGYFSGAQFKSTFFSLFNAPLAGAQTTAFPAFMGLPASVGTTTFDGASNFSLRYLSENWVNAPSGYPKFRLDTSSGSTMEIPLYQFGTSPMQHTYTHNRAELIYLAELWVVYPMQLWLRIPIVVCENGTRAFTNPTLVRGVVPPVIARNDSSYMSGTYYAYDTSNAFEDFSNFGAYLTTTGTGAQTRFSGVSDTIAFGAPAHNPLPGSSKINGADGGITFLYSDSGGVALYTGQGNTSPIDPQKPLVWMTGAFRPMGADPVRYSIQDLHLGYDNIFYKDSDANSLTYSGFRNNAFAAACASDNPAPAAAYNASTKVWKFFGIDGWMRIAAE